MREVAMRGMPVGRLLVATLAFCWSYSEAYAWGDKGHQAICEIAFKLVRQDTRAEIERLIALDTRFKSFPDSCTFPDNPRIRAPEHFVNLARDAGGFLADECPKADVCVLSAIRSDTQILSSTSEDDSKRLIALKSLGHWVGDVHQPLHVSFEDDRGGNKIVSSGECKNLHAVWDNCLVLYSIGPDWADAADELIQAMTPEEKSQWLSSTPKNWATESFAIARALSTGYCVMSGPSCDPPKASVTISEEYLATNEPVVKKQLLKAGVRLAQLLDLALGR
ncbi:S1/P1 nuclease [Bradyrhizobium sp. NBAIM32]|uniref:S1/P1 nuclease n=1 Tax=Bradyrhizobium sp. NBAIM32 TaxID=2793809 RepID=UPI001CD23EEE|nr:S1/P1 nuclease [Bradyrhizobium sp. NBAIM32]MCA1544154.1 S1/P1 nuclease [Bradyrhizobium sp. NBAIM32]